MATTRSVCTLKIQFRSLLPVRRNAVPFSAAALESSGDAAFKNEEAAKYDAQKNTPVTPELKKMLVEDFVKGWAEVAKDDLLAAIPANAKAEEAVTKIEEYFTAHYPDFLERAQTRATAAVMANVAPPVPTADGKLDAHLEGLLKKLNLGDNQAAVKIHRVGQLQCCGNAAAGQRVYDHARKSRRQGPEKPESAARRSRRGSGSLPRAKTGADTSGLAVRRFQLGGGDHHILFSMVRNPKTGGLEMWQCNEDGSSPSKMKSEEWINGQRYEMATDPAMVVGLV